MDIYLFDYQSTSAAGSNILELRDSIDSYKSGLRKNELEGVDIETWIGRVDGLEQMDLDRWQSRNNALACLGLMQGDLLEKIEWLKRQYSSERLGIVMGSSTSSIDRTEEAYRFLNEDGSIKDEFMQDAVHNPGAPSLFVANKTGITGPAITINTACSSSAKVFATGARWLATGLVDAVLVGGVDTLCSSVLYGFHSLQLVSAQQCAPFDKNRNGINLGEASGYAILVRGDSITGQSGCLRLTGYGESSDAHHMSHPHPEGLGAKAAILNALQMANLEPNQIDYINLHGTASVVNDKIEGLVIQKLFPSSTQVSSTKAWVGHTLGAAGITEALIALDSMERGVIPGSLNLAELEPGLEISIRAENQKKHCQHVMTNSFGFGGNNCTLIFSKGEA